MAAMSTRFCCYCNKRPDQTCLNSELRNLMSATKHCETVVGLQPKLRAVTGHRRAGCGLGACGNTAAMGKYVEATF